MNVRLHACGLILLCFVTAAWAGPKEGEPFGPVSPEELKMTSEPLAPGAPAIILYRQVDRDDRAERGFQTSEHNYRRIKILTAEGRKYADIEIPFVRGEGRDITGIRARTIRPDGTIVKYEGKVYEKQIVKAKGLKYMAKTFTMPDVQAGSIIEYEYTEDFEENSIFDSNWIISDELFTRLAKFSLQINRRFPCRWTWSRLPDGTEAPKEDGNHTVRLQVKNIAAFPTEDFMPPANDLKARVDFIYSDGFVDDDLDKFWKSVTKKRNSSVEDFVGKRKAMEEAVRQIVTPEDSNETKLQKIYARVQQFRNTSFEAEKTEQEEKRAKLREINNVEDLWKLGYGDGEQITWLFLGLARAAGFDASGVLVSSRRSYLFNPRSKDERKLSTNVVLVKLDGKDAYFDPGTAFAPYGLLPWSETNVIGRKLDKDGGAWITTTIPDASVSRTERKADFRLDETGDLEGTLILTLTGLQALQARREEQQADQADRKRYLEDMVKEQIPSAAEVQLTNKPEWNSSAPSLVAEFKVKVLGWMSGAGRRAMLPVGIFAASEKGVFTHSERKHPIYFEFPFSKEDDVRITLPPGWEIGSMPAPQEEGGNTVLYAFKAEKNGSTLHLNRKMKINFYYLDQKYYPTLQSFFQLIRTGDEQQVLLQPVRSANVGK